MIYTSTNGNQMVYAEQYKNKASLEKVKNFGINSTKKGGAFDIEVPLRLGIIILEDRSVRGGIIVDGYRAEPGDFIIMTTTGIIVTMSQPDFCERFVPATYQKDLF